MSDFKSLVKKCAVDFIHTVVGMGTQKFVCFTRLSEVDDNWYVVASDGANVWRSEFDEEALDARRDLVNVSTTETLLTRIRNAFVSGEVSVTQVGTKLTVTIGKGSSAMEFDLYEPMAAVKKKELQTVLFRLAEQTSVLESKLSAASQSLEKLRAQKGGPSGLNALMDLGRKQAGAQAKAKPRKVGMSVVNPGSRKRKAATGVVFD